MPLVDICFGINAQAMAVLHMVKAYDGIESSWDAELRRYTADVKAAPWYNGRERGIVFYCAGPRYKQQLNIAVFEHRNSDSICALKFETGPTIDPPTIGDVPEGTYRDKWDVSHTVEYGQVATMAAWVYAEIDAFWQRVSAHV